MRLKLSVLAFLTALTFATMPALPAAAGSVIVVQTTLDDDGASGRCTLRSAIRAANLDTSVMYCFDAGATGTDTIVIPAGRYVLTQSAAADDTAIDGDLDLTDDVVIRGAGARSTIVDAGGTSGIGERVFDVKSGAISISNLTITGGNDSSHGGGIANEGDLSLSRVSVTGNAASISGGGIYHWVGAGVLLIDDSTISGNQAAQSGGGLATNYPGASVTNTTIFGNRSDWAGGGVAVIYYPATLTNVTIVGNRGDADDDNGFGDMAGGLFDSSGLLTLVNTLIAGNADGATSYAPDCRLDAGPPAQNRNNLIGDTTNCNFSAGTANIVNVDPRLGAFGDNGGPTKTQALRATSPARNAAAGCPATDQRGVNRGSRCEIGAYEYVTCRGVLVNRVGTAGNDRLTGTSGRDGMVGYGGKDKLIGGRGADGLCGGGGNDRLSGGGGKDKFNGGGGANDRCRGGNGTDAFRRCETIIQ